ncbi:DUF5683 domain-containing protein [Paenibacillus arenilitoris]|uniref:hypothetical protein n=1 Tax=Paenibacillus arenilitoris TaxID=2772299 RepID=UPI001CC254EF|nr:hypothetical protein [Paenibacillus arenilitoris]
MEGNEQARWPRARISSNGVTHIRWINPLIVAWWSAAFPGFGHYLLNQYIRATLLTLSEVVFNTLAHINEALVYSFSGNFSLAVGVLDPRWAYGYLLVYMVAIWDSYRSSLQNNRFFQLAELENSRLKPFFLGRMEVQYLEKKSPVKAALFSAAFPGMGHLYNHRVGLAFYAIFWWWFYLTASRLHTACYLLFYGRIQASTQILHPHWLLFMPSVIGGAVYHSFTTAIEHNRLFAIEQRQYFAERYGNCSIRIFPRPR